MQKRNWPFQTFVSLVLVLSFLFSIGTTNVVAVSIVHNEQRELADTESNPCTDRGYQKATIKRSDEPLTIGLSKDQLKTAVEEHFPAVKNLAIKEEALTEDIVKEICGDAARSKNWGTLSILVAWSDNIYSVIGVTSNNTVSLMDSKGSKLSVPKEDFFDGINMYVISGGVLVKVPNIGQLQSVDPATGARLEYGCEPDSIYMGVKHRMGDKAPDIHDFTKNYFKYSSSIYSGYVGSPYNTSGWTTSPKAQLDVVRNLTGTAIDACGISDSEIKSLLDAGFVLPVWCHGFKGKDLPYFNSTRYTHCVLIVGYDTYGYYINDPFVVNPDGTAKSTAKDGEHVWYSYSAMHGWMDAWADYIGDKSWGMGI